MLAVVNGAITYFPGRHYNKEVDGSAETVKKFYVLGSMTVAVRTISGSYDTLNWVLSDHFAHATSLQGASRAVPALPSPPTAHGTARSTTPRSRSKVVALLATMADVLVRHR